MKTCLRQKVSLEEHTKRAVYQGGCVWAQYMCPQMRLSNPEAFNGLVLNKTDDGWKPKCIVLPEAYQERVASS